MHHRAPQPRVRVLQDRRPHGRMRVNDARIAVTLGIITGLLVYIAAVVTSIGVHMHVFG